MPVSRAAAKQILFKNIELGSKVLNVVIQLLDLAGLLFDLTGLLLEHLLRGGTRRQKQLDYCLFVKVLKFFFQ